jgi:hypothetical protein
MRGNRFEERCAILTRVRSPHEIEQRMVVALVRTFVSKDSAPMFSAISLTAR